MVTCRLTTPNVRYVQTGPWDRRPTRGPADDPICERERKDLSHAGEVRTTEHRDIAGYRVVAYSVSSRYFSGTVAFAPDLGCMTMSIREVTKKPPGGYRLPSAIGK